MENQKLKMESVLDMRVANVHTIHFQLAGNVSFMWRMKMDNTTKLFQLTEDIISELRKYRELGTIKELKKGIYKKKARKVLYHDIGYDSNRNENVYSCICPTCDLHIITFTDSDVKCDSDEPKEMFHSSMVYHAYEGRNNYCNRCGQKLDWS